MSADDENEEKEDIQDEQEDEEDAISDGEYYSASEEAILDEQLTPDGDTSEIQTFDENIVFAGPPEGAERRRRHSSKRKAKWHRQEKRLEKGLPFCNETDISSEDVLQQLTGTSP